MTLSDMDDFAAVLEKLQACMKSNITAHEKPFAAEVLGNCFHCKEKVTTCRFGFAGYMPHNQRLWCGSLQCFQPVTQAAAPMDMSRAEQVAWQLTQGR